MKTITIIMALMLLMTSMVLATTLSVTDSKYIAMDSGLLSPAFMLTLRGDNSPDYISFAPADQITGTTPAGDAVQAKSGFRLDSSIESESCQYDLTLSRKTPIIKTHIETKENVFITDIGKQEDNCAAKSGFMQSWREINFILNPFLDVKCLYYENVAYPGDVSLGKINFLAKFSLTKDGGTPITSTISTISQDKSGIPPTVAFKDQDKSIAIIRWIGGSTYGENCPSQTELMAVQKQDNNWILASKSRFTEYQIAYQLLLSKIAALDSTASAQDKADLESAASIINQKTASLLVASSIRSGESTSTITQSTANLILGRDHLIYTPDFQLFIRADWLQLMYLTGKPKITASSFGSCVEGNAANQIGVTIQNIGASKSKFISSIKCEEGIIISTTERSITLNPEESGTLTYPFTVNLEKDSSKSCVVTVSDYLNIENVDAKTITSDCKASVFCNPEGITKCEGTTELKCANGQWITTTSTNCQKTVCDRDQKCEADKGESFETCGGKTASNNDCATCNTDKVCDSTETIYSCAADCGIKPPKNNTIIWVIVGGGAAAAIVFGYDKFFAKKKGKKPKKRRR
jgi:hypothetical protein